MKKPILVVFVASLCSGCMTSADVRKNPVIGDFITTRSDDLLCIPTPKDPSYEGHTYDGAGRLIVDKMGLYLTKQGRQFRAIAENQPDIASACEEKGAGFVLLPEILTYEDRATGWSGKPDRIEIRLSIFDRTTPHQRRSVIFEAQSDVIASSFGEWGNANPTALLNSEFGLAIKRLLTQEGP